jgi:hypothetical protein
MKFNSKSNVDFNIDCYESKWWCACLLQIKEILKKYLPEPVVTVPFNRGQSVNFYSFTSYVMLVGLRFDRCMIIAHRGTSVFESLD